MKTGSFDPGRARDAWATIRGYVYQVDATLERWLRLDDGEILELERGEDIDLLSGALKDGGDRDRLLEQVKHLEGTITLRSGSVRAFLANAHAHRNQNPSLQLRFRFTTTATPAVERPTTVHGAVPGIVAWERIRTEGSPAEDVTRAFAAIRELLTSDARPEGLPSSTWDPFQDFVENGSDADFEAFMRVCEWSTQQIAAADYKRRVLSKLTVMGLAPDSAAAESLYDRLFTYVFRVLGQPDLKQLTVEALLAQVELWQRGVPLSPEDLRRVSELRETVRLLDDRVANVESEVSELQAVTARSTTMIEAMARQQGISAAIDYVVMAPLLVEPPLMEQASPRHQTVAVTLRELKASGWLALYGVSGIGKSHLALLTAGQASETRVWIRFRDLTVAQAAVRLDAAMANVVGRPTLELSRVDLGTAAANPRGALSELGRGAVVVLDDLPRYRAGDEFAERLISLVQMAASEGVLVITTSPLPIPSAIVDSVGVDRVTSLSAPSFTSDEVRDVLAASGASDQWKELGLVQLIHTATHGHPTLVRACVRDLASLGWPEDMEALGSVMGLDFAEGLNDETIRTLIASAPDAGARELLFRLNLILGEFTKDEVQLLAQVNPPISAPRTHLDPLLGLWVQSDTDGRYAVSPLVRPLGGAELAPDTFRECHRRLAKRIVSRKAIGDLEVSRAMSHFVSAEEYNSAAWVLLRGLVAIREMDVSEGMRPIFALAWIDVPLPEEMDLGIRLMIRSLQLGYAISSGRSVLYIHEDLERLLTGAGKADQWAAFTASMFATNALSSEDVAAAGRHLVRALRLRHAVMAEFEERELDAPDFILEQVIWMLAPSVDSPDALSAWIAVLEAMTPEERAEASDGEIGRQGASNIADRIMFSEAEKPTSDRDWEEVLQHLSSFEERARAMDIHVLADAAIVTRMVIHGEHLNDVLEAEALSEEVLTRSGLDADTSFLVTNCRALLLYDYGAADQALDWLRRAFALRTPTYGWQSVRAAIYLSIRLAESDQAGAIDVLTQAARFADEYADEVGLSRLEVYGELGVAEWLTGDLAAAFRTWDCAAKLLLDEKADSPTWRSLFVLFGHISGYFASVAATGRAPGLLEGGEPYVAPTRGLFMLRPPDRDELYSEEKSSLLPVQLALFGDAVGAQAKASTWARTSVEQGRAEGRYETLLLALPVLIAEALEADDYELLFTLAWEHGAVMEAGRLSGARPRGGGIPPPVTVLGKEGGDHWLTAEAAAMLVLVPIYFRLALLARHSPEEARTRLPALFAAMRTCAARSADPDGWHAAVELFDAIFVADESDPKLVARANRYAFRSDDLAGRLQMVAYLAASTRPGTPLDRSIALQLTGALLIGRLVLPDTRVYGELAGEFLGRFWKERFKTARFRFSNPGEVERALAEADDAGVDRARLVLAVVANGLGTKVEGDLREWLNAPTV